MALTDTAPPIKKASPHDVKKAFGVHAQRVLEVIDSHADCLEGIVAQVTKLTELPDKHSAQIDALLDGQAANQQQIDDLIGQLEMLTQAQLVHTTRLIRLEAPMFLSWRYLKALWS